MVPGVTLPCPLTLAVAAVAQDEFKATMKAYFGEMVRSSFKLMEAFCIGLGIEPHTLRPLFEVS